MDPREGTQVISEQVQNLLDLMNNEDYSQPLNTFNGSSIGQHIRHIVDFYLCLINGLEAANINYDKRKRNPNIEKDCLMAKGMMAMIGKRIQTIDIEKSVMVCSSFVANENVELKLIPSSIGRELMYAYDHAIHHLAIIKIGMKIHFPEISISKDLGVAPSTLKYRQQCVQ
ncbi:MAG: hypothetical protein AB8G11_05200 [Saprospiraceae bacterium]